jgi:hypothetical protein
MLHLFSATVACNVQQQDGILRIACSGSPNGPKEREILFRANAVLAYSFEIEPHQLGIAV